MVFLLSQLKQSVAGQCNAVSLGAAMTSVHLSLSSVSSVREDHDCWALHCFPASSLMPGWSRDTKPAKEQPTEVCLCTLR